MDTKLIKVAKLKANPTNPRVLRDEKFACLTCGNDFTSKKACKSRLPKFCSMACYAKRTIPEQTRARMSAARSGRKPHNTLPVIEVPCGECGAGMPHRLGASQNRKYCSLGCRISAYRKMDYSHLAGEQSHLWRGGITGKNELERRSARYGQWRRDVFARDKHTCQQCGKIGGYLHADHIKPFAYHQDLRYEISNGRTLCVPCHRKTDTFGSKAFKHAVAVH